MELLDPLIKILHGVKDERKQKEAIRKISSYDYRKTAFNLEPLFA
ncbi:MAG: hypothetical protein ACOC56_00745 [Atribacterota bacterium]